MAGKKYLRCGCPTCGNVLTYPDYSAGGTSVCEKCGRTVRLPAAPKPATSGSTAAKPAPPQPPPARPPRRGFLRFVLWAMNLAIVAAVAIVFLKRGQQPATETSTETDASRISAAPATSNPVATTPSPPPTRTNIVTITNIVMVTNPPPAPTNRPPPSSASTNVTTTNTPPVTNNAPAAVPAATNRLTVLGLSIERPRGNKGSRLTYVTGVLQNQSDRKRFGVRIDLNLLDRARNRVGMATDYTAVIEPKGTWRFRALVLDARAVGASVAGIQEDQ